MITTRAAANATGGGRAESPTPASSPNFPGLTENLTDEVGGRKGKGQGRRWKRRKEEQGMAFLESVDTLCLNLSLTHSLIHPRILTH